MTIFNRSMGCTGDTEVSRAPGPSNRGNGKANFMTVGAVSGHNNVALIAIDISNKTAVATLTHAYLRLTVAPPDCAPRGSNVCFWVERTTKFTEGNFAQDCADSETNATVWPGPDGITTDRVKYNPASNPGTGTQLKIDVVNMMRTAWAANQDHLYLRLTSAETGTSAYDIDNPVRTVTFYTQQAGVGKRPHLDIEYDDNYRPLPPGNVTPATTNPGEADERATIVPTRFSVGFTFLSGGAPGDYVTAAEFRLYNASATDNEAGAILTGAEVTSGVSGTGVQSGYPVGTTTGTYGPVTIAPSLIGKELRGRLRIRNKGGKWSPWTRLMPTFTDGSLSAPGMRIIADDPPKAPTNLAVDPNASAPDYSGTHNDSDPGSTVSAVETQVWKQTATGVELIENQTTYQPNGPDKDAQTGDLSTFNGVGSQAVSGGVQWTVSHTGRELQVGERINRRHRTVDQYGVVGSWSAVQAWTITQATAPAVLPRPGVKQDTITPAIGATYATAFTSLDVEAYQAQDSQIPIWAPGPQQVASTTSASIPYGSVGTAADLAPGQTLWVRARVYTGSAWTDWSERSPVLLNSLPLAPALSVDNAVESPAGYLAVADRTPRIRIVFRDPDLPGDTPTGRVIRFFSHPTGALVLTNTDTVAPMDIYDVPAGKLLWEQIYEVEAQYADSSGTYGATSERLLLKVSQAPVLTLSTPPDPNDPTPIIAWNYSSPSGKPQAGAVIEIYGPES